MRASWIRRVEALRRRLGQCAEPSGREVRTAATVESFFRRHGIGTVERLDGSGGLLVRIPGGPGRAPARRAVLRCELDGLPIPQTWEARGRAHVREHSHRCGHDGHMAIVAATGVRFFQDPPPGVELVLLFQSAEETGEGARRIVDGQALAALAPRMIVGFHNLPGVPLDEVVLRPGVFAAASCGWSARLTGRTSHAAEPERGRSPTAAVLSLAGFLEAIPGSRADREASVKATVVHLRVGQVAFGTTPGEGVVMATFRAWSDWDLERVIQEASAFAMELAAGHGLGCELARHEPFPATVSDPVLTGRFQEFLERTGRRHRQIETPFLWSEDFGRYAALGPLLYFGLGAGEGTPALHHPDYVFPDLLIPEAAEMIHEFLRDYFGQEPQP